ncbi:MAG: LytR/AlgR family response regulator transcription factor [Christensenellales bacterium]
MTGWEIHRSAVGQKQINIILCDDDSAFLKELNNEILRCCAKLSLNAEVSVFTSIAGIAPDQLASCNMAFLDIDFEDEACNGIDIARKLREVNCKALIFFVTNFIDYAPVGYEVQAFRYILKRDMGDVLERYFMQAMEQLAGEQEYMRLWDMDRIVDIPLEQITYLEVLDHSVSIHAGERYMLGATLTSLESRLESHGFLRVHKSFLVNMRHIRKFRSRECVLADGTTVAVSDKNYSRQKQKYLLWKGLK